MTSKALTIAKDITPLVAEVEAFKITSPETMEQASELLSRMNKRNDEIAAEKDKTMRPALDTVAAIRAQFAPFEKPLTAAIESLRKAMGSYQTEQRAIEAKKEADIAARVGSGKGKIKLETAIEKVENIERAESTIATATGSVKFRTQKNFEVIDIKTLPADYLLPNEVAIRKAMKDGVELKGVRYFEEQVPVNSR